MNMVRRYVGFVDALNRRIGRVAMWGIFVMMGILLWSSISKAFFTPANWTLETAQFAMVAYYVIGGPYAIQMGSHVRMDLFYGNWSLRRKAVIDAVTVLFLIFYLCVLIYGALGSLSYSLGYWGMEPVSFFTGPRHWFRGNRTSGTLPNRLAALPLAGQDNHVVRILPDVASGASRAL